MRIPLRLYSVFWVFVIILYSLNLTEFSSQIDKSLLFFLLFSSLITFLLSYVIPKTKVMKTQKRPKNRRYIIFAITVGFILDFIYGGYIPFFAIANSTAEYRDFSGIPSLHPFLVTFSCFYYFYLMYAYFSFKEKKYLFSCLVILLFMLLIFSRNLLVFLLLGTVLMGILLKKKKIIKRSLQIKRLTLILLVVLVVCYIFGGLGNVRCGYSWNDCSFIERIGLYTKWPFFIPKQYMWVYSYLTSPLANLNYNVIQNNHIFDLNRLFVSYIPDFISNRFFPEYIITSEKETLLIYSYFNAQTTFVEPYYAVGILGCYVSIFLIVLCAIIISRITYKYKIVSPIPIVTFTIFIAFTTFYNVFYYGMTTLLLIWTLIYMICLAKKSSKRKLSEKKLVL